MRNLFILLGLIVLLGWFGFEMRSRDRAVSYVLFGFAALFTVMLVAVFYGWV